MSENSTVLILTAGFGDGHNSAARSLAEALRQESGGKVEAVVADLFEDAAPVTGAFYKWVYRQMSTYLPACWHWLFEASRKGDFHSLWWDRFVGVGAALERRLQQHRPFLVVLTYPVYPYFLENRFRDAPTAAVPVWMTITDSITIHPIWLQGKVDRLYVTDEISQEVALAERAHPVPVEVSGFPVAPGFAGFPERKAWSGSTAGLNLLYFATTASAHVRKTLAGLLEELPPGVGLTVVTGRHERRLQPVIAGLLEAFPHRQVRLLGWTREVPRLLMEHDLVISKAGGATVHECFAAGVPVVVNYIIPGQEEGNAVLLERLGCGCRSADPGETGVLVASLIADGRLEAMSRAMREYRRPDGALRLARDILRCSGG